MPFTTDPIGSSHLNPFDSELSRAKSAYFQPCGTRLVHAASPAKPPSRLAEAVHDAFRTLILDPRYSCLGAKAAVRREHYRLGVYDGMGSPEATAGLARDLVRFVQDQDELDSGFTTYVASFAHPTDANEVEFERLLWVQLQALHDHDWAHHPWDATVSSDPEHADFSLSVAGRAFFIVGLHPRSSRWTRQFPWPTLVFNARFQFERLRERGQFQRMQALIRSRERALQGNVNVNLSDFGVRSEARQYSGRAAEADWRCPFQPHAAGGEAAEVLPVRAGLANVTVTPSLPTRAEPKISRASEQTEILRSARDANGVTRSRSSAVPR